MEEMDPEHTWLSLIDLFQLTTYSQHGLSSYSIAGPGPVSTWPWTHKHTHTRLTALFPGLPGWTGTRKVKPIWILLKQETVSGSGISWAICKSTPSLQTDNHASTHHSSFLQARCPSCHPTNSVKALNTHVQMIISNWPISTDNTFPA